jgi:hypothetical protein
MTLGVIAMNKKIFTVAAAVTLGLAATLLMPVKVTASGLGSHSFHVSHLKFLKGHAILHHRRNFRHGNNGLFAGYSGYSYWPTYSTEPAFEETPSVRVDPAIPPPPGLSCERNREVVTVPSEADGGTRQITITRC